MNKRVVVIGLVSCLLIVAAVTFTVQADNQSNHRIGYVDLDVLFANHPQKEYSEEQLREEAQSLQQQLEEEAADLTSQERQELLQNYQQQLEELEQDLIAEVMEDINEQISKVAEEAGVSVVLDKSAVVTGGYDLTEEVIEVLQEIEE